MIHESVYELRQQIKNVVKVADGMVEVQYLARSPIRFHGQNTGSLYQFSAAAPIQKVHASDLAALTRSRFFQIRQSGR